VDALEAQQADRKLPAGDEQTSAIPQKLLLFVEPDSEVFNLQQRSTRSGDLTPWLAYLIKLETVWGHLIGGTSVDNVEYAAALNLIADRVARLNAAYPAHPYDFQIVCPEAMPPYKPFDRGQTRDTAEIRKKYLEFGRTKFNYFAHDRDRLSSSAVRKSMLEHPDYKGVIFYGTAHLLRGIHDKSPLGGKEFGIDTAYDYYLAHFLDQDFGRDSVAVFTSQQEPTMDEARVDQFVHGPDSPDYVIMTPLIPPGPSPLEIMPSRTVLNALRQLVQDCEKEGTEHGRMFSRAFSTKLYLQLKRSTLNNQPSTRIMLDSIHVHTRDTSAAAAAKKDILLDSLISAYDGIASIDSIHNWFGILAADSSFYDEMLNLVIKNMPGADTVTALRGPLRLPLDTAARAFLHTHLTDRIEYFLVNMLWIGTPDEKTRARAKLIALTGQSYQTAEEWSIWWRSRYN
jgi:hypothetical protein